MGPRGSLDKAGDFAQSTATTNPPDFRMVCSSPGAWPIREGTATAEQSQVYTEKPQTHVRMEKQVLARVGSRGPLPFQAGRG